MQSQNEQGCKGEAKAEYLAIVEEILEMVSLGADVKEWAKTAKFLTGAAIAAEARPVRYAATSETTSS